MTRSILPQMRKRDKYKNTESKDGSLTPHLYDPIASRIRSYCKQQNISVSKFVGECVESQISVLERKYLEDMPKEMLIELYLTEKNGK